MNLTLKELNTSKPFQNNSTTLKFILDLPKAKSNIHMIYTQQQHHNHSYNHNNYMIMCDYNSSQYQESKHKQDTHSNSKS